MCRGGALFLVAALISGILSSGRPALGADRNVYQALSGFSSNDLVQLEIFSGIELTRNSWLTYAGGTWTPEGQYYEQGLRLRFFSSYGHYGVDDLLAFDRPESLLSFQEQLSQAELLLGYGFTWSEATISLYLGYSVQESALVRSEPAAGGGIRVSDGIKGQMEVWFNLGSKSWIAGYGSVSSVFLTYSAQVEAGFRLASWAGLGIEGKLSGSDSYDERRIGGFVDFYMENTDLGVSFGYASSQEYEKRPYVLLSATARF